MTKDLAYYRQVPYEREWAMREDCGERYFVVRLKDLPAVAGDGATFSDAIADLRNAFDEFVTAWLEAGRDVPEPTRGFTVPSGTHARPELEYPVVAPVDRSAHKGPSWIDSAVLYTNDVVVRDNEDEPRLTREAQTAAIC